MSLRARLEARIAAEGPISVADYMTACLHDPEFGYYATRPRLGAEGDFITAPLVSQMFGELIGLWAVEVWERLGRPKPFRLVEVGPGDGTLMSDLLRAARLVPAFLEAAELWLVETSRPLRAAQAQRSVSGPLYPTWANGVDEVEPGAPMILIANELLDCLPVVQVVRTADGWAERSVGWVEDEPAFVAGDGPIELAATAAVEPCPVGAVLELSPMQIAFAYGLGACVARDGGCALLIDYGRDRPGTGDTLQAIKGHQKVDPLACPGEADLTVHADFPAVADAARAAGAQVTPIVTQARFLRALGIEARAAALQQARPDRAEGVARQLHRLIAPDQMGKLFKALAIHTPGLRVPGFEDAE